MPIFRRPRAWTGLLTALSGLVLLCGAAPAPEGNETRIGIGMGTYEYRSGGCGGTRHRYDVTEPIAHLQVRHQTAQQRLWVGEASLGIGMLGDSRDDPNDVALGETLLDSGEAFYAGLAAVRYGHQYRYGGFELGPGAVYHHRLGGLKPVPSGGLWVGTESIHLWADVFSGPLGGALEFAGMAGVGHSSRLVRARVGTNTQAHLAEVDMRVGPGVRLGVQGGYGTTWNDQAAPNLRGMLNLTIDYRAFTERP